MIRREKKVQYDPSETFEEKVLEIGRVTKVVKGGKNLSFRSVAVVGNKNGLVGVGIGNAREVPDSIRKAIQDAKKNLIRVPLRRGTLPHEVTAKYKASVVKILPAAPGTGIIAGAASRAVLELAGVQNALSKSYRSRNKLNLARATIVALKSMKTPADFAKLRDRETKEIIGKE